MKNVPKAFLGNVPQAPGWWERGKELAAWEVEAGGQARRASLLPLKGNWNIPPAAHTLRHSCPCQHPELGEHRQRARVGPIAVGGGHVRHQGLLCTMRCPGQTRELKPGMEQGGKQAYF